MRRGVRSKSREGVRVRVRVRVRVSSRTHITLTGRTHAHAARLVDAPIFFASKALTRAALRASSTLTIFSLASFSFSARSRADFSSASGGCGWGGEVGMCG